MARRRATNFSYSKQLSAHNSMFLAGWGGVTILGAIDSIPLGGIVEVPVDPEAGIDWSAVLRLRAWRERRRLLYDQA